MNIHITDAFEKKLLELMRRRGIATKSEAVRVAVREALERDLRDVRRCNFDDWLGIGLKAPENSNPKFLSHDELWD